jgi:hypothetical protein
LSCSHHLRKDYGRSGTDDDVINPISREQTCSRSTTNTQSITANKQSITARPKGNTLHNARLKNATLPTAKNKPRRFHALVDCNLRLQTCRSHRLYRSYRLPAFSRTT